MRMLTRILHFDKSSRKKPKKRRKLMEITAEDIRAIQHKLDSLRKMKPAVKKPWPIPKKKAEDKLEDDVYDYEKFFDVE